MRVSVPFILLLVKLPIFVALSFYERISTAQMIEDLAGVPGAGRAAAMSVFLNTTHRGGEYVWDTGTSDIMTE